MLKLLSYAATAAITLVIARQFELKRHRELVKYHDEFRYLSMEQSWESGYCQGMQDQKDRQFEIAVHGAAVTETHRKIDEARGYPKWD